MKFISLDGVSTPVRVTRVTEHGYDWVTLDGAQGGAVSTLPLYDADGNIIEPTADPTLADIEKGLVSAFRALATTDIITEADALENQPLFPLWADCIGQVAREKTYWLHHGLLYRVNVGQTHTIQADWTPDAAPSLFSRVGSPADEYPEWLQPTGAHNAYELGAKVTHNTKRWVSTAAANVWEPGVYGWSEVT